MNSFSLIPIVALSCYLFLLLAFVASKKTSLINSFILVLVCCVLWTGGSFLMRQFFWPSEKFWYDVSICGLLLLSYALLRFVREFAEEPAPLLEKLWLILILVVNVVNIKTGAFLKAPEQVVHAGGEIAFVYDITWGVGVLVALLTLILIHTFCILYRMFRKDELKRRSFQPVVYGLVVLFVGHVALLIPFFEGFPIDILASVVFVFCIFYALYRKRLFRLNLLVSKGVCYVIAALLSVAIFVNIIGPLEGFIRTHLLFWAKNDVIVIALLFSGLTVVIYSGMKRFIDSVFVKEESLRAETLREFGAAVSKSLEVGEILEELVYVVKQTLPVKKVYVCVESDDGRYYRIAHSENPLDSREIRFGMDNPMIDVLRSSGGECLFMEDLRGLTAYKSMWEEEKREIKELGVECIVPLCDDDTLVGMVLLTAKEKNAKYTYDDISFLTSMGSIGSIAVKNARLYEKARKEARTDDLTGLLNRKYFHELLQKEYEKSRDRSLSLMILSLDDFKLYNQLYGNKEGDVVLQKVAGILQASVGESGYVARYSGKEFAILLPDYDILGAKLLAEGIRKQISEINRDSPEYGMKTITVSGGICAIPYAATSPKELLDNADMAVFQVKRSGKNAIQLCTGGLIEDEGEKPREGGHKSEIYSGYAPTIYALTAAIDTKDHYTFSHSKSVAYYACELAYAFGMNEESVEIVREAALLHDIGKIGISEQILNKPGRLTQEEYEIMKGHVENSVGIIRHLPSLDYVIPAVIGHHERYDGKGYPRGIAGNDISLLARILCVADSFDAMVSHRPYKKPYPVEYALEEIERESGKQFDPKLATLFVRLVREGKITPIISELEPSSMGR